MKRLLTVAAVLSALSTLCASAQPEANTIAGSYYRGDGLGYNFTLRLHVGGRYTATWEGCLGTYEEATGTWQRFGEWLSLEPRKDMLKLHLRMLLIISKGAEPALVPEADLTENDYITHGADSFLVFTKQP